MVAEWRECARDALHDCGAFAFHLEHYAAVADGFGIEREVAEAAEELQDVGRGVRADAGEFDEALADGFIGGGGVLEPRGVDLTGDEHFGELDDSRIAVADAASGPQCCGALCGDDVGCGEGTAAAEDFAQALVHADCAGPGDVATGDGFDDVFEECGGAHEPAAAGFFPAWIELMELAECGDWFIEPEHSGDLAGELGLFTGNEFAGEGDA